MSQLFILIQVLILIFFVRTAPLTAKTINQEDNSGGYNLTSLASPLNYSHSLELGGARYSFTPKLAKDNGRITKWEPFDKTSSLEAVSWFFSNIRLTFAGNAGGNYFTEDLDCESGSKSKVSDNSGNNHFEHGEQVYVRVHNSEGRLSSAEWGLRACATLGKPPLGNDRTATFTQVPQPPSFRAIPSFFLASCRATATVSPISKSLVKLSGSARYNAPSSPITANTFSKWAPACHCHWLCHS